MSLGLREAAKWILRNTLISNESLTPEIQLRLITTASPLWMSTPDSCPLIDPYWAFYWPGGQGLTRYILDHEHAFRGSIVMDFGSGCGSAAIASRKCGATSILANDIDKYALLSTKLNFKLNQVRDDRVRYSTENFLDENSLFTFFDKKDCNKFILLGDMFYDSEFAESLFTWLKKMSLKYNSRILVGDPDRHPLAETEYVSRYKTRFQKLLLAEYSLPGYVIKEHYGFNTSKVFEIKFC